MYYQLLNEFGERVAPFTANYNTAQAWAHDLELEYGCTLRVEEVTSEEMEVWPLTDLEHGQYE